MALSDDDRLQLNSGTVNATTSVVVTVPSGTTADSTVIVWLRVGTAGTVSGPPAGFVAAVGNRCYYKLVGAGETSWTFTTSSNDVSWVVMEWQNLDLVEPFEAVTGGTASNVTLGNAALSTDTTSYNIGLSTVTFVAFSGSVSSGTATKSWGSYTGGFEEVQQVANTTGTTRPVLTVTRLFTNGATALFSTSATQTISTGTSVAQGNTYIFREAGSLISAPLASATGFEFGTHAGLAENTVHATGSNQPLGPSVSAPTGTWGTHYQIGAFGRNGDYGMRISTSAATCHVPIAGQAVNIGVWAQNLCVQSGSGTPTVMTFDVATGTDLLLVYDVATEMFGLRWGAGSVSWQTGTTPLGSWAWVEVRVKVNATTHHADWWIETGTGDGMQTSPADLTGMSSTTLAARLGSLASQTVTFDVDDVVRSAYYAAFPLGSHRVVRLVPESTGATVSGTSTNFSRFTANGTLAALTVDTVGALLDECPPTLSASADGICQTATAASDYVQIPFQDLTLAPGEIIAFVRLIASMWSGTGAGSGQIGLFGWDGSFEMPLASASTVYLPGSPTAYSATAPVWMAAGWFQTPNPIWTLAKLNAACVRMGKSPDATPDMGMSAVYLEVAIREISNSWTVHRLTDDEDPEVNAAVVTETLHPYNSAVRTFSVSNDDPTRTAEFRFYEAGGAEHALSPVTIAPTDPPEDVTIGAEAFGEIESTSFGWI